MIHLRNSGVIGCAVAALLLFELWPVLALVLLLALAVVLALVLTLVLALVSLLVLVLMVADMLITNILSAVVPAGFGQSHTEAGAARRNTSRVAVDTAPSSA